MPTFCIQIAGTSIISGKVENVHTHNNLYYCVNDGKLNYENGDEVSLTQKQIINIVIKLKSPNKEIEDKVYNIFQNTNFGKICLN